MRERGRLSPPEFGRDDRFTVFRTAYARSRFWRFLECLSRLHATKVTSSTTKGDLAMMRRLNLAGPFLERLAAEPGVFADEAAWHRHLGRLGLPWTSRQASPVEGDHHARSRPCGERGGGVGGDPSPRPA